MYCTVLYCVVLYCTVLCCTVLYRGGISKEKNVVSGISGKVGRRIKMLSGGVTKNKSTLSTQNPPSFFKPPFLGADLEYFV